MSPKRCLSSVQRDIVDSNRQLGAFAVSDEMDRFQGSAQIGHIYLPFRPAFLEARLRFGHAILDGFHAVAACKRPPQPCSVGLQYDIRINQYGVAVSSHDASQIDCAWDVMRREEIREILDAQIEQPCDAS